MANRGAAFSGGSGAGYHGVICVQNSMDVNVIVGEAGIGHTVPYNNNAPASTDGTATVLSSEGQTLISAGGGTAAASWQNGGAAGIGGTITSFNLDEEFAYFNKSGNNGNGATAGGNISVSGALSVYNGHTFGSSGGAWGGPGGGACSSSRHGYVLIKYLGKTAPEPPQLAYRCYSSNGYFVYVKEDEASIGDKIYDVEPNYSKATSTSELVQNPLGAEISAISESSLTYSLAGYSITYPRYTDGDLYE